MSLHRRRTAALAAGGRVLIFGQYMPLTTLEHYHSLVPLDTHPRRNASIFGYPSWVYNAMLKQERQALLPSQA